ncbi:hypothetical protein C2G38_2181357 [Gigaspora rosea]|uniref:Uncharacterized protein n=1 Tax=Gigaspora rosea TaxID=44941 RepID=A0A397VAV6_9GLOM
MKVKIVKAKVGMQNINCRLEPGFLGTSICSDKLLKKIGSKISRKLTPEEKDSKFIREETTAPLGLAIIPLTFTSNIKNNDRLSNKNLSRFQLNNNWFYGKKYNNDELQIYIPEIVIDAENAFVRTTLHIKDLNGSEVSKTEKKPRVIISVNKEIFMIFTKYFLRNQKIHCIADQISLQLPIQPLSIRRRFR